MHDESVTLEQAIAEQVAIAAGRKVPTQSDIEFAIAKADEWNALREKLGLPRWK